MRPSAAPKARAYFTAVILLPPDRFAAVFISSDGNLTDAEFRGFNAEKFPAPIYPILDDEESEFRDLCIDTVSVQQTDFETSPTKIQVQFHSSGLSGETATIQLIDLQTGELIEELQQTLEDSDYRGEVQFRFRPEQSGVTFYEVLAFTELDKEALLNPTADGIAESNEATLLNNAQLVSITRETGPYRILYLSGRPNWEFKFLRRSLQADAEVQLVGLIRIAKKEPKFSFRDRSVSSTNPLFAGLGKDEEDSFLHRGIAKRSFTRKWTLAEHLEVKDAELKDGIILIKMKLNLPEEKKAKTIKII